MKECFDVPLSQLTTFKNEGVMGRVLVMETLEELCDFCRSNEDYILLGKGSNTVINPDTQVQTVLKLSPKMFHPVIDGDLLRVGAGTSVKQLLDICIDSGLSGLEFTAGVPASVGGMVAMNFGCWGACVADLLTRVHVLKSDGSCEWMPVSSLGMGYRTSVFQQEDWVVLETEFRCSIASSESVKKQVLEQIQHRLAKQPLREPTFGSVFKNPIGGYAAQLIEAVGLKGKQFGDCLISDRHSNFMVNKGRVSYDELVRVLSLIQDKVSRQFGADLELEVRLVS